MPALRGDATVTAGEFGGGAGAGTMKEPREEGGGGRGFLMVDPPLVEPRGEVI